MLSYICHPSSAVVSRACRWSCGYRSVDSRYALRCMGYWVSCPLDSQNLNFSIAFRCSKSDSECVVVCPNQRRGTVCYNSVCSVQQLLQSSRPTAVTPRKKSWRRHCWKRLFSAGHIDSCIARRSCGVGSVRRDEVVVLGYPAELDGGRTLLPLPPPALLPRSCTALLVVFCFRPAGLPLLCTQLYTPVPCWVFVISCSQTKFDNVISPGKALHECREASGILLRVFSRRLVNLDRSMQRESVLAVH